MKSFAQLSEEMYASTLLPGKVITGHENFDTQTRSLWQEFTRTFIPTKGM